ncbi:hypothetical protein ACEVJL_15645 [Pseudoflavonifractor sp. P01025]|jgi:hypothetical protein|uniref:hypothetical protein n=1 Tax=Eubacteriales TaxID=186802 RepID=UPI001120F6B6|nr:hypothetical protein [Flavonifractor sp. An91]
MIIQSCAFTIHFPHNTKIREHLFELEKHFTDFQKPFTLVPLPPDAPMEIPRIVAATEHGHSQLTICGNSAQLVTNFDAKFNRDIKRCVEYVSDKCNRIVSALSIMDGSGSETPKFYFSGLSMTLLFDHEDGIVDSVDYVSKNFIDYKTNLPTDEVQFRLALVIERKYYVNVMVQNSRTFSGVPDERGSFAGLKNLGDRLQVILDINDRYAFNHEPNYTSCVETVSSLSSLAEQFAAKYISSFIKNGEINYVGQ